MDIELRNVFRPLLRWWWLIIAIVLVSVSALWFGLNAAEKTYKAQVKLQLTTPQLEDVAIFDEYRLISQREAITVARNNFFDVLESEDIINRTINKLDLDDKEAEFNLETGTEGDSDFIFVSIESVSSQLASLIANTLVDEAIIYYGQLRARPTEDEKALYAEQVQAAETAYRAAVDAFTEFKTVNNIATLDGEIVIAQTLLEQLQLVRDQRLLETDLSDPLDQIDDLIELRQAELERLTTLQPRYAILEQNALQARLEYQRVSENTINESLKQSAEETYLIAEEAFATYKAQHEITSLEEEIDINRRLLEQLQFERDQQILEEPKSIQQVDSLITQRQRELDQLISLQPIYTVLESEVQETVDKYQYMQNIYYEAVLKTTVIRAANFIQIIEPATAPEKPTSNMMLFTLGAGGSLGFAVLLAYFLDYFTGAGQDINIVDEIQSRSVLGLPIIGMVPSMKNALPTRDTLEAEAFRQLRTRMLFASPKDHPKTILVTSSQPGDGKSVITANLGSVMSSNSTRVVIVDADLRNPSIHEVFDQPNISGLAEILAMENGTGELFIHQAQRLKKTNIPGLSLLTAGHQPQDPSYLLSSRTFKEVLGQLSKEFDYILIDTPPLLSAPDATIMANIVDGIVIVVDPQRTRVRIAREALDEINSTGDPPIIGIVLNRTFRDNYAYQYNIPQDDTPMINRRGSSFFRTLIQPPTPNLISEKEASVILGVQLPTVKRWRREGRLPTVKFRWRWWVLKDELMGSLKDGFQIDFNAADENTNRSLDLPELPVKREEIEKIIRAIESDGQIAQDQLISENKTADELSMSRETKQPWWGEIRFPTERFSKVWVWMTQSIKNFMSRLSDVTSVDDFSTGLEPVSTVETNINNDNLENDDNGVQALEPIQGQEDTTVTVDQAADMFEVNVQTVRRWCREGRLPAVKDGRSWKIKNADIEEFAAGRHGLNSQR